MSHRAFAKITGLGHALISYIVNGERSCPLNDLDDWIDILEIPSSEKASFKEAALLTHANEELREYIDGLHARIKRLEKK